jgi:hypothetical protein
MLHLSQEKVTTEVVITEDLEILEDVMIEIASLEKIEIKLFEY